MMQSPIDIECQLADTEEQERKKTLEYQKSAAWILRILQNQFNINFDTATEHQLKALMLYMRFIDKQLDSGAFDIEFLVREVENPEILHHLHMLYEIASNVSEFKKSLMAICQENQNQRNGVKAFSYSRSIEGSETAMTIFYFIENTIPENKKDLVRLFLWNLGGMANTFDTLLDLKEDGRLSIYNLFESSLYTFLDGIKLLWNTPQKISGTKLAFVFAYKYFLHRVK